MGLGNLRIRTYNPLLSVYDQALSAARAFRVTPISCSLSIRWCVGVLGGMGPLATVDYLQKIIEETPASNDQGHVPCVVVTIPQAPDRTECITIACNTSRHWANELVASLTKSKD
jgi:Asp/Glu/Hydantoin racemase